MQSILDAVVGGFVEGVPEDVALGGQDVPVDHFGLGHFFQTFRAMGAANAGLLPATPGGFGQAVAVEVVVDGGDPGLQAGGNGAAALVVFGPYRGGQCQFGFVGLANGFFFVGHTLHGYQGPEGLVAHGEHVVGDIGEQRGRVEEAVFHIAHRAGLGFDPGAFGQGIFQMLLHGAQLAGGGQTADIHIEILAADSVTQLAGLFGKQIHKLVVDRIYHIHPFHAATALPGILVAGPGGAVGGTFQIRVFQHQHGIIAAQLQGHRGEGFGGLGHQGLAGGDAAGEEQFVHAILEKAGGHFGTGADDMMEQAFG